MIKDAKEFIKLRQSENRDEQERASREPADLDVWLEVIKDYPNFKSWVIHNKTIQIEILEILCSDSNPEIRACVARKRKINDVIFNKLSNDPDENVRFALMFNTKLPIDMIKKIKIDDSKWLKQNLEERVKKACN